MTRNVLIEGIFFIAAGFVVLTNDYLYDSLIGASLRITFVKWPLGIGLLLAGILLVYSHYKK